MLVPLNISKCHKMFSLFVTYIQERTGFLFTETKQSPIFQTHTTVFDSLW